MGLKSGDGGKHFPQYILIAVGIKFFVRSHNMSFHFRASSSAALRAPSPLLPSWQNNRCTIDVRESIHPNKVISNVSLWKYVNKHGRVEKRMYQLRTAILHEETICLHEKNTDHHPKRPTITENVIDV